MTTPYYFGFGSLVNTATLPEGTRWQLATLRGWRRCWNHPIDAGDGQWWAAMNVREHPGCDIDGILIEGGGPVDDYLSAREAGYRAVPLSAEQLITPAPLPEGARPCVWVSAAPAVPAPLHRLRSYSDVITLGFLELYGKDGLVRYRQSTDDWALPVIEDSAAPRYPRAVPVSAGQRALIKALDL